MKRIFNFIAMLVRQMFCDHASQQHVRNIHGDEINYMGGKRSIWRCNKCSKLIGKPDLKEGGYSHATPWIEEAKVAMASAIVKASEDETLQRARKAMREHRACKARKAYEDTLEEELWVLPPGGATEAQILAVGRIIDAEGEKS